MNVHRWARERPDHSALVFGAARWTWRQLDVEVSAWVARLRAYGVEPGDRIGLLAKNRPEAVFLIHASTQLGATLVPFNARLRAPELAPQVALADPRLVVAEEALAAGIPGARVLERMAEMPPVSAPIASESPTPVDSGALLFTSGTTGIAKAAYLTRANFEAHVRASTEILGASSDARWLGCLPLFHIGGLAMVLRCAAFGSTLILHDGFRIDAVARSLREDAITHLSVVPTALGWMLEREISRDALALQVVLVGGAAAAPHLLAQARESGLPVLHTYGLTEACSQVCTEHPDAADGMSAGVPLPNTEVRIVDADGLPTREGEIEVRGPTVITEYFRAPEASRAAFRDGWLRTRDLGSLDDRGRLYVLGRRFDLIISGGENIYPAEIENVLLRHAEIADVAVVGVEDATWGHLPVALFVPRSPQLSPSELESWCRTHLAGFKVPRRFSMVAMLPRNASGKLDRAALPALAAAGGIRAPS